jgi:hypothetical protein
MNPPACHRLPDHPDEFTESPTKPRDLDITPGSIASESAVLQRAFVNHPGQIPAGSSR